MARGLFLFGLSALISSCVMIAEKPQKRPEQGDYTKSFKVPEKLKKDYEIQEDPDQEEEQSDSAAPTKSPDKVTKQKSEKKSVSPPKKKRCQSQLPKSPPLQVSKFETSMKI